MSTQDQSNTSAFYFLSWMSFLIASISMLVGIGYLPAMVWIKGFFALGYLFTVTTCFMLAKIIRDKHEVGLLISRVQEAETEADKQDLIKVLRKMQ